MLSSALIRGEMAPEFDAVTFDGQKVSLSRLRQEGPVVLVFLRGFG
jgi:peroxiredoxin